MKRLLNIRKIKNRKTESDFNIDQVLNNHNIDYSDIDFENKETDILKSFNTLNSKLNTSTNYFANLKSILSFINFKPILKPLYTIALTSIVIFTVIELKKNTNPVQYAEITVDKGEKITLHVTDNFTIYLNSESTIKIPLELKRNSEIYLDGEAYFEVNQNKKIIIIAGKITFKGKDCDFHINSKYNNQLIAHVKEGSLDFYNPEFPKSTKITLSKGDKASYNPFVNFISIEQENTTNYLAWHNGTMEFTDTPMYSVINTISDYFGIPIKIENSELNEQKFTARIDNLDIDEILDTIQSTFNCEISADGSMLIIN